MGGAGTTFTLSISEQDLLEGIVAIHNSSRPEIQKRNMIANLLKSVRDMDSLLRLSLDDDCGAIVNEYYAQNNLDQTLFAPLLKKYTKKSRQTDPLGHEVLKNYQLLFGLRCYDLFQQYEDPDILNYALKYHSFQATQDRVARFCDKLNRATTSNNNNNNNKFYNISRTEIIRQVYQCINYHGTPGLLLLFLLMTHISDAASKLEDRYLNDTALAFANAALKAAKTVLPYSERSIDAAYMGHGIGASNLQGISDLDAAIDAYTTHSTCTTTTNECHTLISTYLHNVMSAKPTDTNQRRQSNSQEHDSVTVRSLKI